MHKQGTYLPISFIIEPTAIPEAGGFESAVPGTMLVKMLVLLMAYSSD